MGSFLRDRVTPHRSTHHMMCVHDAAESEHGRHPAGQSISTTPFPSRREQAGASAHGQATVRRKAAKQNAQVQRPFITHCYHGGGACIARVAVLRQRLGALGCLVPRPLNPSCVCKRRDMGLHSHPAKRSPTASTAFPRRAAGDLGSLADSSLSAFTALRRRGGRLATAGRWHAPRDHGHAASGLGSRALLALRSRRIYRLCISQC